MSHPRSASRYPLKGAEGRGSEPACAGLDVLEGLPALGAARSGKAAQGELHLISPMVPFSIRH